MQIIRFIDNESFSHFLLIALKILCVKFMGWNLLDQAKDIPFLNAGF